MLRFLKQFLLFAVAVFAAIQLVHLSMPYYWGNKGVATKLKYIKQNNIAYNTFFIGSSRVQFHISPQVFDSVTGFTRSYNLGYSSMTAEEALYLAEHIINDADHSTGLKYLFLEVRPLFFDGENLFTARGKYQLSFSQLQFFRQYYAAKGGGYELMDYYKAFGERLLTVGMIRDMLQFQLFDRHFANNSNLLGQQRDGFMGRDEAIAADDLNKLLVEAGSASNLTPYKLQRRINFVRNSYAKPNKIDKANEVFAARISKLIADARAKGIQVIVFPSLRFQVTNVVGIINNVQGGVKLLDNANPDIYPELYSMEYSGDLSHLNYQGSLAYSAILANEFKQAIGK